MRHFLIFFLLIVGIINISTAKEVDPETAKLVAQNHYLQVSKNKGNVNFELVYTSRSKIISNLNKSDQNEVPLFYIFNADNNNGYVIVSGDDNVIPVLGYSTNGNFDISNLPPNFRKWLEGYKNQIRYVINNDIKSTDNISGEWEKLIKGLIINTEKSTNSVSPLLTTTWDQSPYYNALCPFDFTYNELTVTGCVATAMAQVMKYWNYPAQGAGFHSYNHSTYGVLSANFGSTSYNWASMPNNVNVSNSAVATLMYHCGVSLEMNYGVGGSSTSSLQPVADALGKYFSYSNSIQFIYSSSYSNSDWIMLLKTELDAGRPIEYAGVGTGGGHAFVCDGYDNSNYFHFNWGWSGLNDGYFQLDALDPSSTGTGGGTGGYNNYQQAVIGIQPPAESITYDMSLYDNVVATPNPILYGQGFTVHTDIANLGTIAFTGDYCAAIFDDNNNFVEYVEILSGYSLGGGNHYTSGLDFTNSGMLTVLPGAYHIGIFYKPTSGNWIQVSDGSYSNMISFEVNYSNDIELYQDMIIDYGTTIPQNQSFIVTLDIINDGSIIFNGEFSLSLYNIDGSFEETIQTLTGASLDAGFYYNDLEFTTSGVSVSPGTYLLALMHKADGGSKELTGSTYYTNPIKVIIQEEAISLDMYESNNVQNDAYFLTLNFIDNNASIETTSSNLHVGSDYDYYKIDLVSGFDYIITARVHDSYDSDNGQTYTCDVLWSYLNGSVWSDPYDDVMPGNIIVNNGGTIYFHVAPYFAGEKGTYLLELDVSRTLITGTKDFAANIYSTVFPNPATDIINIEVENIVQVNNVKIVDILGKQMLQIDKPSTTGNNIAIPINELPKGMYILLLETDEISLQHKFIKSK